MKKNKIIISFFCMFFLIIAWFITAFQIALYADEDFTFFRKEYEKYNVTKQLNMSIDDVIIVTDHMMDYLIGKNEVLSIKTNVDGTYQDFFNQQDRLHMKDVRNLFLGGLKLRNICLLISIICFLILILTKSDLKKYILKGYIISLLFFLLTIIFLTICALVNFTETFRIFHEIFFTNDLWMFDPQTDYMIRMLPEGFFFDIAFRIIKLFISGLVILPMIIFLFVHNKNKHKREI